MPDFSLHYNKSGHDFVSTLRLYLDKVYKRSGGSVGDGGDVCARSDSRTSRIRNTSGFLDLESLLRSLSSPLAHAPCSPQLQYTKHIKAYDKKTNVMRVSEHGCSVIQYASKVRRVKVYKDPDRCE